MKQEADKKSRQYSHINEGHGLAITKALEKSDLSIEKILGWEKEGDGKKKKKGAAQLTIATIQQDRTTAATALSFKTRKEIKAAAKHKAKDPSLQRQRNGNHGGMKE